MCTGGGCIASGALEVSAAFTKELEDMGIARNTQVIETGCLGPCAVGPVVLVYPDGVFYQNVQIDDVREIVEEHLLKGRIVDRLVSHAPGTDRSVAEMEDVEFFNRQVKIVLRNSGIIDPLKIEEYIAREGYQALAKVLTEMTPEEVVERSAALAACAAAAAPASPPGSSGSSPGRPSRTSSTSSATPTRATPGRSWTGRCWKATRTASSRAWPSAPTPSAPRRASSTCGPSTRWRSSGCSTPSTRPGSWGLLGKNIMGTGFEFDLEIRMGSGAFVCGEETALMRSIEGGRGEPRPRPPFPAVKGLWGKPSVLNNVETFANIAPIILKGAEWYASTGTEKSKGTKVFALGGAIQHAGLVEVPIGVPAGRDRLRDRRRHPRTARNSRPCRSAARPAAASPRATSTCPVDYETLQELGAIMGSGG